MFENVQNTTPLISEVYFAKSVRDNSQKPNVFWIASHFSGWMFSHLGQQARLRSTGFNDILDLFEFGMFFVGYKLEQDRLAGAD